MFVKSNKEHLGICWWLELHSSCQGYQARAEVLNLALQMVHYGLCLGALQFRLQCVLLHGGGVVDLQEGVCVR